MEEDESIILHRCLNGEESGFRSFYQLFHIRVYHLCLGFFSNEAEAQDATQEIFMKIFAGLPSFKGEAQLQTWVYAVALNYCRMEKRRQGAVRRFAFLEKILPFEQNQRPGFVNWEHPGVSYEKKENAGRLLHAVHRLPPSQRDAILLVKSEELSYKEAAAVMKVSVSALESLISRALVNLRKFLRE
jgi:RNA polymerase sigma-70 factor (ECF subfamily)